LEDAESIWVDLKGWGSILVIPDDLGKDIRFCHTSLRDFLTDSNRSKKHFIDATEHHLSILDDCIRMMTDKLTLSDGHTSGAVSYACKNWYHHMSDVVQRDDGIERIKSHSGALLDDFLACLKSDLFQPWLNVTMYGRNRYSVEREMFTLASITKVSVCIVNLP
jgi:hypothetical protein